MALSVCTMIICSDFWHFGRFSVVDIYSRCPKFNHGTKIGTRPSTVCILKTLKWSIVCSDLHTKICWKCFFVRQKCRNYGLVTIIMSYQKLCQRKICPMKFRLMRKSIRGWAIIRYIQSLANNIVQIHNARLIISWGG